MRRVIGYANGRPIWSENVEGYAVLYRGSIRGELVTGAAGPNDLDVRRAESAKSREKANAAQRAYYARKTGAA